MSRKNYSDHNIINRWEDHILENEDSECTNSLDELSEDSEIDFDSLENYLMLIQENPTDENLIIALVELLERHQHFSLALQTAKIGLSFHSHQSNLHACINRLPYNDHPTLLNLIKNMWFSSAEYICSQNTQIQNLHEENLALNLDGMIMQSWRIPSLGDIKIFVPEQQDFFIMRKFYLEPYEMYMLRCKTTFTQNIKVSIKVTTKDNIVRLNHQLDKSTIQYKFNSLDQVELHISLCGANSGSMGKLHLLELSLEKLSKEPIVSFNQSISPTNRLIDKLVGQFPLIGHVILDQTMLEIFEKKNESPLIHFMRSVIPYLSSCHFYLSEIHAKLFIDSFDFDVNTMVLHRFPINTFSSDLCYQQIFNQTAIGYQMILNPRYIYQEKYFPHMISKIKQYQHKCLIGIEGSQINQESRKIILAQSNINRDVKCHLISEAGLAFFSGAIYYQPFKMDKLDQLEKSQEIWQLRLAIFCQLMKKSLICVERMNSLVRLNKKITIKSVKLNAQQNDIINQVMKEIDWKF